MYIFRQFLKAKTRLIVEIREAEVITLTYLISLSINARLSLITLIIFSFIRVSLCNETTVIFLFAFDTKVQLMLYKALHFSEKIVKIF